MERTRREKASVNYSQLHSGGTTERRQKTTSPRRRQEEETKDAGDAGGTESRTNTRTKSDSAVSVSPNKRESPRRRKETSDGSTVMSKVGTDNLGSTGEKRKRNTPSSDEASDDKQLMSTQSVAVPEKKIKIIEDSANSSKDDAQDKSKPENKFDKAIEEIVSNSTADDEYEFEVVAPEDLMEVEVVIDETTGEMVAYTRQKSASQPQQTTGGSVGVKSPAPSSPGVSKTITKPPTKMAVGLESGLPCLPKTSAPPPRPSIAQQRKASADYSAVYQYLANPPSPIPDSADKESPRKSKIPSVLFEDDHATPRAKSSSTIPSVLNEIDLLGPISSQQLKEMEIWRKSRFTELTPSIRKNDLTEGFKSIPFFHVVHANDEVTQGYVSTAEELLETMKLITRFSGIQYPSRKSKFADFGKREFDIDDFEYTGPRPIPIGFRAPRFDQRFTGRPLIPTDDTPMVFLDGVLTSACQFSVNLYEKKYELKEDKSKKGKKKEKKLTSKLVAIKGCEVLVFAKEVFAFPEFKIKKCGSAEKNERVRQQVIRALTQKLELRESVKVEKRIYLRVPTLKSHNNHAIPDIRILSIPVDRRVEEIVKRNVEQGITRLSKINEEVTKFSKEEFFARIQVDTPFFPSPDTLGACIHWLLMERRFSKLKEDCLEKLIQEYKEKYPDDYFHFCPMKSTKMKDFRVQTPEYEDDIRYRSLKIPNNTLDNSFIFIHQTQAQYHVLKRYNTLCFLDPVYRRMDLDFPLYFLVVKTNVSFVCVATFIVQYEDGTSIAEALSLLKNKLDKDGIKLKAFMLDTCEAEHKAVRQVFPDCLTFISDFHREQAFDRFAYNPKTGLNPGNHFSQKHYRIVGELFQECAHAESERTFFDKLASLHESEAWTKFKRTNEWFTEVWEKDPKNWVFAHTRNKGFYIDSNDGLNRMNKVFRYEFLQSRKEESLSKVLSLLVDCFVPLQMSVYSRENTNAPQKTQRQFKWDLKDYLRNRPVYFIKQCLKQIEDAQYPHIGMISETEKLVFKVQGTKSQDWNTVNMNKLSCTCSVWMRTEIPCCHVFSVVEHTHLSWTNLPETLRNHPLFTLDMDVNKLVNHNVVVPKDMSSVARVILEELDAGLEQITPELKYAAKEVTGRKKKISDSVLADSLSTFHDNDSIDDYVDDDDDYSNSNSLDAVSTKNSTSLGHLASQIRDQCKDISDMTYQATSGKMLEEISRDLDRVIQRLTNQVPPNGYETINTTSNRSQAPASAFETIQPSYNNLSYTSPSYGHTSYGHSTYAHEDGVYYY